MKPIDQSLERLQILCEAFSKAFAARVSIMHRPGPEAEGIEFALDDIQSRIRALIGDEMRAPIDPGLLEIMPAGDYHVGEEGQITPIEPSARDKVIASTGLDFVEQMEAGLKRARMEDIANREAEIAAPSPDLIATKIAEQLVGPISDIENLGEMIAAKADSLVDGLLVQQRAKIARLEAALGPFARIHERRSEGNERSASVSQSPAACSVQDCQAAWLALNPANAVRDADPDLGDVDPGR